MKEEADIISQIINGADRYEELVQRYHVGLIIHCERIVHDRDQAEDMAQEAFIKTYFNLKDFDAGKSRFSTWLYRIATNLCIDYLRSQKRKINVEDIEEIAEASLPTYESDEQKAEIRSAILALTPPEYRQVVEAYYWQGKSYREIADEMNKPINTIRTWLSRAKEKLGKELA